MTAAPARRFYDAATADATADGFAVLLDGRPVRTPGRAHVALPTRALAEAVAAEWRAQGETIDPHAMPLMRLVSRAIDIVPAHRARLVGEIAAYGATDLLCYRAEAPAGLLARQEAVWQPILDWAAAALGLSLVVTAGIIHVDQPPAALAAARAALGARDDLALAALDAIVRATGSLVLGLAVAEGRLAAAEAAAAARLDETWQAEQWGEDGAAAARLGAIEGDIEAAARLMTLAAGDAG